ncbi:MAG: hypothetical protein PVG83_09205 [Acidimicrobiia bacterium]
MADTPNFETVDNWAVAESRLGFTPLSPASEPGVLRIHVRDHKEREVEPTLEAHFDRYVLSQARRHPVEARRLAYEQRYGVSPESVEIGGHEAVAYELGTMPEPGDIDPRPPAVVTWADKDMFVLLASDSMPVGELIEVARSLYPAEHEARRR